MKNNPGKLIVVSAPSGAGKTTLCQRLLADFAELVLSISSTTRAPRGAEQNGREYFFLTREQFQAKVDAGLFAEWARVHDNFYGTSREVIDEAFRAGKSVLLDIDVQGAASLQKVYQEQTFAIFVQPPSLEVLEARLRARGTDKEETIQRRLKNAQTELAQAKHFDHILVNDELDRAYQELRGLVEKKLRPPEAETRDG